jgi:uncharacterized membrane protein (DUF4010 family)
MGAQARKEPLLSRPALAGAVLSTVATTIQLTVVLAATSWPVLSVLKNSLIGAGLAAIVYGAFFTFRNSRKGVPVSAPAGRVFSLKTTLIFAATIAVLQLLSAVLDAKLGRSGVIAAAAAAGFADTHSPAVAVATLVASGKLSAQESALPILAGLTTNTVTKMVVAISSGGKRFALQIIPGLILVIVGAWLGAISFLFHF